MKEQTVKAPDFPTTLLWLNTPHPLSLDNLRGYIVLLDFWTFACINCMHVIPELAKIEQTFRGKPVVIIGVHSAKFEHEQQPTSIQAAIERTGITHPVLIDEEFQVWNEYAVKAWPTFVLIDSEGYIRAHQSGERTSEELEQRIGELLREGIEHNTLTQTPKNFTVPKKKTKSTLLFPGKISIDQDGHRVAISDSGNNRVLLGILKNPTTIEVNEIIGSGKSGNKDGLFEETTLRKPQGVAIYEDKVFICDTENHVIRRANLTSRLTETIIGTGHKREQRIMAGLAKETDIASPWDVIATDTDLYIAMAGTHQLWQYDRRTKMIEKIAGSGIEGIVDGPSQEAQLAQPSGLSLVNQTLYFADSETSSVRAMNLETKTIHTLIGTGLFTYGNRDGAFEDALLQHDIGLDATETHIFVADSFNHAVRKMDLRKKRIRTLIGPDAHNMPGELFEPNDVQIINDHLYITDTNNHAIKVLNLNNNQLLEMNVIIHDDIINRKK